MRAILRLLESQPGDFFCISINKRKGNAKPKWTDKFFARNELHLIPAYVEQHKADSDVYFCPHGFSAPRRIKANAVLGHYAYADLDEVDPRKLGDWRPTLALQSSPGRYQGFWRVDGKVTEEMNKALTYKLGADKGGWDLTQVLRVPGTLNLKPHIGGTRVKRLWEDETRFSPRDFHKLNGVASHDPKAILARYKVDVDTKLALQNGPLPTDDRSRVLFKICCGLADAGMSADEIYMIVKPNPWNKFKGRESEEHQLRREINKALERAGSYGGKTNGHEEIIRVGGKREAELPELASLHETEEIEVDWLWYGLVPMGELTVLEGVPQCGKSYLCHALTVAMVSGRRMPNIKTGKLERVREGNVLLMDLENHPGAVTKKRVRALGIDDEGFKKVFVCERVMSVKLLTDMDMLRGWVRKYNITLIIFDTITTYMAGIDTHKQAEVMQGLAGVKTLCKDEGCAAILIRHYTKSKADDPFNRGTGAGFLAAVSSTISVGYCPGEWQTQLTDTVHDCGDSPWRGFGCVKARMDEKIRGVSAFNLIRSAETKGAKIVWGREPLEGLLIGDVINTNETEASRALQVAKGIDPCEEWLRAELARGPKARDRIMRIGNSRNFAEKKIENTAAKIGVIKNKGQWSI